jgi:four helix bundle protein
VKGKIRQKGKKKAFDIKQRTFEFGVRIVRMVNSLPKTVAGIELGRQVVRAGTSIGANVEEANGASSKKDFVYKMTIARKEARDKILAANYP